MNIKARPVATITRSHHGGSPADIHGGSPADIHGGSPAAIHGGSPAAITVAITTEPGTVTVPAGTGTIPVAYGAGDVVISDQDDTIAGPLSRDDALALAKAVLEGQRRAVTHPQLHLLLSGAVLAFAEPPGGSAAGDAVNKAGPPAAGSHEAHMTDDGAQAQRTDNDQS